MKRWILPTAKSVAYQQSLIAIFLNPAEQQVHSKLPISEAKINQEPKLIKPNLTAEIARGHDVYTTSVY
ncbi:MAG: hypothetical protein AAFV85_13120 [Cyanobacteria bacterium J06634_6]